MSVYKSVSKSVFRSVYPSTKVPLALLGSGESFTFLAGPATPATGSNLSNASTFFSNLCLPVSSTLKSISIRSNATASVKLKLAVRRAAGGWTVTDLQTFSVTSGVNTFTVAGATLNSLTIPAGAMLGLFCSTTGALQYASESLPVINEGYTAFTGDVSGNVTAVPSQNYQHQLQFNWEATAVRSGLPAYIFEETFDGTTLPARHINSGTPWTFAAGTTTPGADSQFFRHYYTTNADRRTVEVDFQFTDTASKMALGTIPVVGGASTDDGSLIAVDIAANTLIHYNPFTSSIPTVRSTDTITGFTLSTGVNYRLKLTKSGKSMMATIMDLDTPAEFSISKDNDVSSVVGNGFGAAMVTAITAAGVTVSAWRAYLAETNPIIATYGDSITQGSGTTDDLCFGQLLIDDWDGRGIYSGDGGTTVISCYRRWLFDSMMIVPKYVVILAGANNANSDVERDLFEPDMTRFIERVVGAGSIPVVCYVTPNSDGTKQARIDVMNGQLTTLLASFPTAIAVRTDQALSVGNDGSTWDTNLFFDGVHPNTAGHALVALTIRVAILAPTM